MVNQNTHTKYEHMIYLFDLRFEDIKFNAIIHLVLTYEVSNEKEGKAVGETLFSAFKRKEITVFNYSNYRIDNDANLQERSFEYFEFSKKIATASIKLENFFLEKPNQNKSLGDNLLDKLFNGEKSIAKTGEIHKIPVRVLTNDTRNPILGEFFYYAIEHLSDFQTDFTINPK